MIIADTCSFTLGKFTVQQRPRPDNPAWPVYIVFRGEKLIGKSFSIPDLGCCEWLERTNGVYATPEESYQMLPLRLRGAIKERVRRPAGRPRREDSERELAEAISDG